MFFQKWQAHPTFLQQGTHVLSYMHRAPQPAPPPRLKNVSFNQVDFLAGNYFDLPFKPYRQTLLRVKTLAACQHGTPNGRCDSTNSIQAYLISAIWDLEKHYKIIIRSVLHAAQENEPKLNCLRRCITAALVAEKSDLGGGKNVAATSAHSAWYECLGIVSGKAKVVTSVAAVVVAVVW